MCVCVRAGRNQMRSVFAPLLIRHSIETRFVFFFRLQEPPAGPFKLVDDGSFMDVDDQTNSNHASTVDPDEQPSSNHLNLDTANSSTSNTNSTSTPNRTNNSRVKSIGENK